MKINKNLRNCYIKVTMKNISQVHPLAKLFPKNNKLGHGALTHELNTWVNHLNSNDRNKNYYVIDESGSLFYIVIYKSDESKKYLLEGKKELTSHNQLQETLQDRIKNFKV
jgi:hypothetical protein